MSDRTGRDDTATSDLQKWVDGRGPLARPPSARTHGPDLSAKKSRSTFSWPISRYSRAIRASSFLALRSLPLPKTPGAP